MIAITTNSCCSTRKSITTSQVIRDSVFTKEIIRDTVISFQSDTSMIRMLLECDSMGIVREKQLLEYKSSNRLSPPKVVIKDNVLTSTANIDSVSIYFSLKDRYTERNVGSEKIIIQEVNKLTWWQTLWVWIGKISVFAAAGLVGLKFLKL